MEAERDRALSLREYSGSKSIPEMLRAADKVTALSLRSYEAVTSETGPSSATVASPVQASPFCCR